MRQSWLGSGWLLILDTAVSFPWLFDAAQYELQDDGERGNEDDGLGESGEWRQRLWEMAVEIMLAVYGGNVCTGQQKKHC